MNSKKNLEKMKFIIITLGCQMNKSDSERIEGLLLGVGMREAGRAEEADLIILNTCSVRQTAEDRVYGLVRNFSRLKRQKPHLLVAVTGCIAGRDKDGKIRKKLQGNPPSSSPLKKGGEEHGGACTAKLREERSGVDFFFPISDLPRLPELLFSRWRRKTVGPPRPYSKKMDYLRVGPKAKEWWRGWVVIQTGCSNYCTYCVVPYARGHEKNRPVAAILAEVRRMVKNGANPISPTLRTRLRSDAARLRGAREIQLLGQAVNGYCAPDPQNFSKNNPFLAKNCHAKCGAIAPHFADTEIIKITESLTAVNDFDIDKSDKIDKKNDFAALLWEINQIPGVNRIGFSSAHPMYMTDEVIEALKLPKMMNYLHLPVQSGNNEILRKMNRNYTAADYLKIIKKIRRARPGIALATDIIVGFPGETKKQFADTVRLYKKCDFDLSYPAMYSPRTGTAAYKAFVDDVPREEKRRRWLVLQKLMEKTALRKNKKFIGKTVEVLVDGCKIENSPPNYSLIRANKRMVGRCYGFSREYKRVSFPVNKNLVGQIINVKIESVKEWEMQGTITNYGFNKNKRNRV